VHLKALGDGELRLVRRVVMVGLDEIIFETLSKKLHLHLDHHPKFTVVHRLHKRIHNIIIKTVQSSRETTLHYMTPENSCLAVA